MDADTIETVRPSVGAALAGGTAALISCELCPTQSVRSRLRNVGTRAKQFLVCTGCHPRVAAEIDADPEIMSHLKSNRDRLKEKLKNVHTAHEAVKSEMQESGLAPNSKVGREYKARRLTELIEAAIVAPALVGQVAIQCEPRVSVSTSKL